MKELGLIDAFRFDKAYDAILDIMEEMSKEGKVFSGREDRLATSLLALLIVYDNEPVGFFYATCESRYPEGLFIDMGILEEYRGLGIGREVLDEIMRLDLGERFLIGETKKSNFASNTVGNALGAKIGSYRNKVYYLFPKEKLNEFKIHNSDHRFEEAISHTTQSSKDIIREIMNDESYRTKVKKLSY